MYQVKKLSKIISIVKFFFQILEIKQLNERIRCLKVMVDLLPKANRCVLDRLMYHLARIAHQVIYL